MKIITKFAFVALVACVITMGGVKANAFQQTCDPDCVSCQKVCGQAEADCMDGCGGGIGGPSCWDTCIGNYQACSSACYNM
jgi:hypothetical protein